jgi:S-adenosylmethionine decarboxylase
MTMSSSGHHWLLDLSECRCDRLLLQQSEALERRCVAACNDSGMQIVGQQFHQFAPHGVTGVVLLAESHLTVHTWPEIAFVAADVYVCDYESKNFVKGQRLVEALKLLFGAAVVSARDVSRASVPRGTVNA